jgi:WD40 repeat protein
VDTGRELCTLQGHGDEVSSAVFTPDGKHIVSGSFDRTVSLWDLETRREVRRFQGHKGEVFAVAVSADGKRILSCSGTLGPVPGKDGNKNPNPPPAEVDYSVRLWDLETGKELQRFTGHTNAVLGVAFSPDGRHGVSAGFDMTVRVWNLETGREVRAHLGHGSAVHAAVFTPDGRRILSGGWDRQLRLWQAP